MNEDQIKDYLKNNLKIEIKTKPYYERFCSAKQEVIIELTLDGEAISKNKILI